MAFILYHEINNTIDNNFIVGVLPDAGLQHGIATESFLS
jgi:hypothetical protein